jgi:pilus assembly protein CpaF
MSFDLILPFFRPIEHLLLSDTVSEIMVNPDASVWIEENGEKVGNPVEDERDSGLKLNTIPL